MIQINQMKLPINHSREDMEKKIRKVLRLDKTQNFSYEIIRQSLDARKKQDKKYVYCIHVKTENEGRIIKKVSDKNIMLIEKHPYVFPEAGETILNTPPVIIGSGPAGLFCGYMLAKYGYRPIIVERGAPAAQRKADVEKFWEDGILNPDSNVQFGEGGAGTFSDGKLNTLVKDRYGRGRLVLEIFVECGAKKSILYEQKPHLGTDELIRIVETIRHKIEAWGGEFRFHSQVTDIHMKDRAITELVLNQNEILKAEAVVLAIGHSARDTFQMLYDRGCHMEQKSFAVGVRVEHPQTMINEALYGEKENACLGAAAYKCTAHSRTGRGVYTFCMCPGGYVVNASSEEQRLAINGMSYSGRKGDNANSAVITTVSPDDYPSDHPLAGVVYQRELEERAWKIGQGNIPVQLYGDYCRNIVSENLGEITPSVKGTWTFGNVRSIFPEEIADSIEEGIHLFAGQITGFDREDAILLGVESRTSSPVRINRNEEGMCNIEGLYPCGEGAGYAGGITSAAMDGIYIAQQIRSKNRPLSPNL